MVRSCDVAIMDDERRECGRKQIEPIACAARLVWLLAAAKIFTSSRVSAIARQRASARTRACGTRRTSARRACGVSRPKKMHAVPHHTWQRAARLRPFGTNDAFAWAEPLFFFWKRSHFVGSLALACEFLRVVRTGVAPFWMPSSFRMRARRASRAVAWPSGRTT